MNRQNITVYREAGRYAGWPANYGIWSWGSEIVLGFTVGFHKTDESFHARDTSRPFETMQARSLDGGQSWDVRKMPCRTPGGRGLSADEHMDPGMGVGDVLDGENAPADCDGGIDFKHPDFALMCAKTGLGPGVRSFFYVTTDRCLSWEGPYILPMYEQTGIAARTDYLVSGREECTLFLTANKRNGEEGRVFCARTKNGGRSFDFLSWIGPEPEGFSIMPASVRLSQSRMLVAVRCRGGGQGIHGAKNWIDLYGSDDDGSSWGYLNRPVANTGVGGNPPTLTMLRDGRLCLTYGFRDSPYGIRARISDDSGESWGKEIVLRDGGGNHDLGYSRTVQRPDGKIVTAYYFNDTPEGERYIAATIWEP
jgi:hypothetical protein